MDELVLISEIFGEGPKMADRLRSKGFDSLKKVAQADAAVLAKSLKISRKVAGEMIEMAISLFAETTDDLVTIKGVGQSTSEKLWEAGYKTIESVALANAEEVSENCKLQLAICAKIVISAREIVRDESSPDLEFESIVEDGPSEEPGLSLGEAAGIRDITEVAEGKKPARRDKKEKASVTAFRRRLARMIARKLVDD